MAQGGPLLLGRRTHEDFYGFWPKQRDNPFTKVLNNVRKYVASTTLEEPLPWSNSTLLKGDAAEAVARSGRRLFPDGAPFASLRAHGQRDDDDRRRDCHL